MVNKMMKTMMAIAAFALAIGNAQARLGWTLEECQNHWGAPTKVEYNPAVGQTLYTFRANTKLFAQVYLLNGCVHTVGYASRDGKFLTDSVRALLQKNVPGTWTIYDDGRGKQTVATWKYLAGDTGAVLAYAILWNYADANGFYKLQVSSKIWDDYVTGRNGNPESDFTNLTNV
jgi:hypothetical protein